MSRSCRPSMVALELSINNRRETLTMQTPSPKDRRRVGFNGSQSAYGKLLTPSLLAAAVLLGFTLVVVNAAAAAQGIDFCQLTAHDALSSCRTGADSDSQLALGKCDNIADAAQRKACQQQAAADLKDARQKCTDRNTARQAVCDRLGRAAYDPVINPANFVAVINNPYFPLTPGTTFIYEGQTAAGLEHVEFFVTHNTKVILGVTCVEVHDTVKVNGELTEDTLDWFAQDKDGNVWYFGENSKQLAGGLIVGLEGSWTGGVGGAKPGIVMKAHPAVGDFYRQEFALGTAEDMAEVVSLTESVTVPYGSFHNCLETAETSPLEPDALENKFYRAGIGNVLTRDVTTGETSALVQITTEP